MDYWYNLAKHSLTSLCFESYINLNSNIFSGPHLLHRPIKQPVLYHYIWSYGHRPLLPATNLQGFFGSNWLFSLCNVEFCNVMYKWSFLNYWCHCFSFSPSPLKTPVYLKIQHSHFSIPSMVFGMKNAMLCTEMLIYSTLGRNKTWLSIRVMWEKIRFRWREGTFNFCDYSRISVTPTKINQLQMSRAREERDISQWTVGLAGGVDKSISQRFLGTYSFIHEDCMVGCCL